MLTEVVCASCPECWAGVDKSFAFGPVQFPSILGVKIQGLGSGVGRFA